MKIFKLSFVFIVIILVGTLSLFSESDPPFFVKDPAINENFRQIYFLLSTHRHDDSDSSSFFNVLPDSPSIYSVGVSSKVWAMVWVSTLHVTNSAILPTYTNTQLATSVVPSTTAIVVWNSTNGDLYVSTGVGIAAWKNTRTGGGP